MDRFVKLAKAAFLAITLTLISVVFFLYHTQDSQMTGSETVKSLAGSRSQLYFRGFSLLDHYGEQAVKIEAEELMIVPKKYYVFNFKPINEIILKNPIITTHQKENTNLAEGFEAIKADYKFSFPRIELPTNIFSQNSTAIFSGIKFNGFRWVIIRDGIEFFTCQAKYGYLDINKSEVELEEIELENRELGKRISAKKGRFDLKIKLVKISASSIIQTHGMAVDGRNIHLDMRLSQIPL